MNEGQPLVSVVVPTFNSAKIIGRCVEAALGQTHSPLEVIVVDDASTDETREIAARYRCTVIPMSQNVGPGVARNRGIEASNGSILFFLDSDVALAPDAVANAVRLLGEDPGYGAVWGIYGSRPMVDDGVVERVQVLYNHHRQLQKLGPAPTGHFASGAVPRRVVDELGAFDERLVGSYANEDHEFSLRIAAHYPTIRTAEVVGDHDDDDRMWSVVRKCFRRAGSLVPLVLQQRSQQPEREATHRPHEVATAFLTTVTIPLPLLSPYLAVVPLAFLLWFIGGDLRMVAFVRRTAGWRLVPPALALSFVYGLAIAAGALSGALRYLTRPRFRQRYRYAVADGR